MQPCLLRAAGPGPSLPVLHCLAQRPSLSDSTSSSSVVTVGGHPPSPNLCPFHFSAPFRVPRNREQIQLNNILLVVQRGHFLRCLALDAEVNYEATSCHLCLGGSVLQDTPRMQAPFPFHCSDINLGHIFIMLAFISKRPLARGGPFNTLWLVSLGAGSSKVTVLL